MGILRTASTRSPIASWQAFPTLSSPSPNSSVSTASKRIDIDPARVQTIYNGLDLADWSTPSAVRPSKRQTRHHHRQAISVTSKATISSSRPPHAIVPQFPNVSFSIAGGVLEPAYFEELQALVRDLNLTDHFHFAGGVTNLREHLSAADIFVLPSRSEGFSNAIVEAMAASLPVVATNVGGNAEAVQDGVSGFIVPPEDPAGARRCHHPASRRSIPSKGDGRSRKATRRGEIHD